MVTRKPTEQEIHNAMLYGICPYCHEPRFMEMLATTDEDDVLHVTRSLTCPHGCTDRCDE